MYFLAVVINYIFMINIGYLNYSYIIRWQLICTYPVLPVLLYSNDYEYKQLRSSTSVYKKINFSYLTKKTVCLILHYSENT
jgi:hypothetical protein